MREYEFVLAANSSNPEQDSSGDNQMQIRIPLSVTADWKVTGKSEPAILEYNITEPRYIFFFRVKGYTLSFYNYEHPKKGHLPILLSRLARDS